MLERIYNDEYTQAYLDEQKLALDEEIQKIKERAREDARKKARRKLRKYDAPAKKKKSNVRKKARSISKKSTNVAEQMARDILGH